MNFFLVLTPLWDFPFVCITHGDITCRPEPSSREFFMTTAVATRQSSISEPVLKKNLNTPIFPDSAQKKQGIIKNFNSYPFGAPGPSYHLISGQACCRRSDTAGFDPRSSAYTPFYTRDSNSWLVPHDRVIVKNQSAAVPFGPFFFWFVPSSFVITSIAQQVSKNHAQSFPMHGISISIPSVLTADPNFNGHIFFDGIKKSWLYRNEPFFYKQNTDPPIRLYTQTANTLITTNGFG